VTYWIVYGAILLLGLLFIWQGVRVLLYGVRVIVGALRTSPTQSL
jgi:hypothetical protein